MTAAPPAGQDRTILARRWHAALSRYLTALDWLQHDRSGAQRERVNEAVRELTRVIGKRTVVKLGIAPL